MNLQLDLEKMTTAEKLRAIELIWEDLSRDSENLPSPSWHEDVLLEREQKLKSGETGFVEWSAAKQQIRNSVK
jgi:hypothetical protein